MKNYITKIALIFSLSSQLYATNTTSVLPSVSQETTTNKISTSVEKVVPSRTPQIVTGILTPASFILAIVSLGIGGHLSQSLYHDASLITLKIIERDEATCFITGVVTTTLCCVGIAFGFTTYKFWKKREKLLHRIYSLENQPSALKNKKII